MSATTRGLAALRGRDRPIDETPRGEVTMDVYHLREMPGGWNVAVVREAGRWRVYGATRSGMDGRIRLEPPPPLGDDRFPSMTTAIEAAKEWLQRSDMH